MTEAQALALFKCLADKSRLQILKTLAKEEMYVELLAQRLDLKPATVSFHLKKLSDAGAVRSYKSQYYTMYCLCEDVFRESILDLLQDESEEAALQQQREEEYRQKVIDNWFQYGKLRAIPAQRKKKRIVLQAIAESFEFDRDYPEKEVNLIIADFHEDFCTIRRDMIAEKLLTRENGIYRRVKDS